MLRTSPFLPHNNLTRKLAIRWIGYEVAMYRLRSDQPCCFHGQTVDSGDRLQCGKTLCQRATLERSHESAHQGWQLM